MLLCSWLKFLIGYPTAIFKACTIITGEFICNEVYSQWNVRIHPVFKIDYDYKNHFPTYIDCNSVIDWTGINLCITDGENQNLSHSTKHLLEWNFQVGNHNLHETQLILRSHNFGTDKKFSYNHNEKVKRKALRGKKIFIVIYHEGLSMKPPPTWFGVSVDHFEYWIKGCKYTPFGSSTSEQFVG